MNYIHAFISFILFWVLFAFQFFFIMTPFLIHEKPKKRCYQFAVPFLCLLVVCLGMFNNDAVLQFLYDILIWIANLAGQIPLLGRYLYAFFAWLAGTILTGLGAFVWSNILLALFWMLVKKLTFRKLVSLWENHAYLFDLTSGEFYEKDERALRQYTNPLERYVLKPRYYNLRVLIMAAVFFCYFIYLITQYVYSGIGGSNIPAMMTPVAGILILGECFAFLNGWQPEKNEGKILAEEENSAECDTIRASLKKCSETGFASMIIRKEKRWQKSPDSIRKMLSKTQKSMNWLLRISTPCWISEFLCSRTIRRRQDSCLTVKVWS